MTPSGLSIYTDADGRPSRLPASEGWSVPERIDLAEDESVLRWEPDAPTKLAEVPDDLLLSFCSLHGKPPEAIASFARQWGLLTVCDDWRCGPRHPVPRIGPLVRPPQEPGSRAFERPHKRRAEPVPPEPKEWILTWRDASSLLNAFVRLSTRLRDGDLGSERDWHIAWGGGQEGYRSRHSFTHEWQTIDEQRGLLEWAVNGWTGQQHAEMRLRDGRFMWHLGSLGSALAAQLLSSASAVMGGVPCEGCGRKPVRGRRDRPRLCPSCRNTSNKAADALRQRRSRARNREKLNARARERRRLVRDDPDGPNR